MYYLCTLKFPVLLCRACALRAPTTLRSNCRNVCSASLYRGGQTNGNYSLAAKTIHRIVFAAPSPRHRVGGSMLCGKFKQKKGLYALLEKWWPERGSNPRHEDFQSSALPTELSGRPRICLINNFFLFGKHFFYFFRGFADNCFILLFLYAFLFYWFGRKGAGRQVIRRGWEFF